MVGKPTIWVEIQHASMTLWLWGWGFKPVLAQCVPHSCHEGTTHRRLNWRGFKKKSCIQRLSQCSFCHKLVAFPTSKKGQKLKNVSRHLNFFVGSHLKPSNIQDNMDRKHHAKNWVPNNKNKWNPCQKLKYALWCSGARKKSFSPNYLNPPFFLTVCWCSVTKGVKGMKKAFLRPLTIR